MTDTASPGRKPAASRTPVLAAIVFALVYGGAMLVLFAPKGFLGTVPASLMTGDD